MSPITTARYHADSGELNPVFFSEINKPYSPSGVFLADCLNLIGSKSGCSHLFTASTPTLKMPVIGIISMSTKKKVIWSWFVG